MVTRQFPKEALNITAACDQCCCTSQWPEEVFKRTGRVCARCLEANPEQLFALVMAEAGHGPYRSAPVRAPMAPVMRWGVRAPHAATALALGLLSGTVITGATAGWSRTFFLSQLVLKPVEFIVWALVFVRRATGRPIP